jgi:CheY-like chemotaxis protein
VNTTNDDSGKLIGYMVIGTEKHSSHDAKNHQRATNIATAHAQNLAKCAFSSPQDKEMALEAGCNNIISKPLNKRLRMEVINNNF